ncbi:DUF488 domain-containing protein [Candidatus Magnetominusculus xianensis]|nr:DUF488 domain-containing protein [Candidatus Magnetominusculus xianensis]MBF0402714.1 DUF488 domain-containing protein [Nitrospirota bacterium]
MKLFTIGFSKKTAECFFTIVRANSIKQLVDIRENNTSQLSGFTKKADLKFFLRELLDASYVHIPELAPDKVIRKNYKATKDWDQYTKSYIQLIDSRGIINRLKEDSPFIEPFVLLCSEPKPDKCHRALAAGLLTAHLFTDGEIIHL